MTVNGDDKIVAELKDAQVFFKDESLSNSEEYDEVMLLKGGWIRCVGGDIGDNDVVYYPKQKIREVESPEGDLE